MVEQCAVPECSNEGKEEFHVEECGFFAFKFWIPGDVIRICPPHSSKLRNAAAEITDLDDWMKNVPPS